MAEEDRTAPEEGTVAPTTSLTEATAHVTEWLDAHPQLWLHAEGQTWRLEHL